jgi:hypothetical protein
MEQGLLTVGLMAQRSGLTVKAMPRTAACLQGLA